MRRPIIYELLHRGVVVAWDLLETGGRPQLVLEPGDPESGTVRAWSATRSFALAAAAVLATVHAQLSRAIQKRRHQETLDSLVQVGHASPA